MKHLNYLKFLILLTIATSSCETLFAQVNYSQSFDANTFPPAGWTLGPTNGGALWSHRTAGTFPTCAPHTGTGMARFNSHTAAAGRTQALITPAVDYSSLGANVAFVSLWIYRDTGAAAAADSLTIAINTTATLTGATYLGGIARNVNINLPDMQSASGWYQYSFNIPASFNTAINYILINGTAETGNSIYIDDVQWDAFPTPCSGKPTAGTILPNTAMICGGTGTTALSLSGATTGFSGITYQWFSGSSATGPWTLFDSVARTTTGTIITTTYYVCVLTCVNSGLTDTTIVSAVTVSTNPVPVVTITPANATYCTGGAPVTIIATGASTYAWSPTTGINTSTDSIIQASPTATTRYVVSGTDGNGCVGTANINISVRTAPVLTITAAPDTVCAGDSVKLTVTTGGFGGGTIFTWGPDSITGASVMVAPNATTVYTVKTSGGPGCPAIDSIKVYASAHSVSAFGYTASGPTVNFIDSSTNATSWNWSFGDGNTSNSQNPTYTYNADSTYTVQLITSGLCNINDTITKVIVITPAGIASVSGNTLMSVYPNPAHDFAVIQFGMNEPDVQISIINSLGQLIANYHISANRDNTYQQQVDISKMATGVYMIRVKSATQNIAQPLIKE